MHNTRIRCYFSMAFEFELDSHKRPGTPDGTISWHFGYKAVGPYERQKAAWLGQYLKFLIRKPMV